MTWEKVLVVIVMGAAFYFILTGLGLVQALSPSPQPNEPTSDQSSALPTGKPDTNILTCAPT